MRLERKLFAMRLGFYMEVARWGLGSRAKTWKFCSAAELGFLHSAGSSETRYWRRDMELPERNNGRPVIL